MSLDVARIESTSFSTAPERAPRASRAADAERRRRHARSLLAATSPPARRPRCWRRWTPPAASRASCTRAGASCASSRRRRARTAACASRCATSTATCCARSRRASCSTSPPALRLDSMSTPLLNIGGLASGPRHELDRRPADGDRAPAAHEARPEGVAGHRAAVGAGGLPDAPARGRGGRAGTCARSTLWSQSQTVATSDATRLSAAIVAGLRRGRRRLPGRGLAARERRPAHLRLQLARERRHDHDRRPRHRDRGRRHDRRRRQRDQLRRRRDRLRGRDRQRHARAVRAQTGDTGTGFIAVDRRHRRADRAERRRRSRAATRSSRSTASPAPRPRTTSRTRSPA